MKVLRIAHVQLAMPPGQEERARAFYTGALGIPEVDRPGKLMRRGGVWFESGTLKVHLATDPTFHPSQRAHPALEVTGLLELTQQIREHGYTVIEDEPIAGVLRAYAYDPFGNRIELIEECA